MKTRALFFGLLIISLSAHSQNWIEFTASERTNPTYEIINSEDTIVEFEINVPGMFSTVVDTFNRVLLDEHTRMDSVGFPEMQTVSFLAGITLK